MIRIPRFALAMGALAATASAVPASAANAPASATSAVPFELQASPGGCTTSASTEAEKQAAGKRVFGAMMAPKEGLPPMPPASVPFTFAPALSDIAQKNIFQNVWTRCGLSLRDRELVTLGILIALRAEGELRYHFPIALRNGLSRGELEEALVQASAYAGMPAAVSARAVAQEVIGDK